MFFTGFSIVAVLLLGYSFYAGRSIFKHYNLLKEAIEVSSMVEVRERLSGPDFLSRVSKALEEVEYYAIMTWVAPVAALLLAILWYMVSNEISTGIELVSGGTAFVYAAFIAMMVTKEQCPDGLCDWVMQMMCEYNEALIIRTIIEVDALTKELQAFNAELDTFPDRANEAMANKIQDVAAKLALCETNLAMYYDQRENCAQYSIIE